MSLDEKQAVKTYKVNLKLSGVVSIEDYILDHLHLKPRSKLKKCFLKKCILVNSKPVSRLHSIQPGDVIEIYSEDLYDTKEVTLVANESLRLESVIHNDALLVVDKPALLHSHPHHPRENNTALNGMIALNQNAAEPLRLNKPLEGGLLHRLDHETSGLLVCALNKTSFEMLKKSWLDSLTEKIYITQVSGCIEPQGSIECELSHHPKNKRLMILSNKKSEKTWKTKTSFYRLHFNKKTNTSLILVRIFTGVTHQIRSTCAQLGHPLVNDHLYSTLRKNLDATNEIDLKTKYVFQDIERKMKNTEIDELEKSVKDLRHFYLRCIWIKIPNLPNHELYNGLQKGLYLSPVKKSSFIL